MPGEHIECDIVVPTHNELNPADMVYLHCHAAVEEWSKRQTSMDSVWRAE